MSFFKKIFGESTESKAKLIQKRQRAIPLKEREKIQILQTVSEKNYKIVRSVGATGDQIDHYQYYDNNGKGVTDFTQVLWLFDNMVKSNLVNVTDHVI